MECFVETFSDCFLVRAAASLFTEAARMARPTEGPARRRDFRAGVRVGML